LLLSKSFYALNVQAICDRSKRFLWCFPSNKGSIHDSSAFAASRLQDLLREIKDDLVERRLFIVGDSAYSLAPYLLIPYDADQTKQDETGSKDGFNYHLSSCRIYIECAFGELIMRWGIFWRTLLFDLKKSSRVIQVAMLLHNYIVDQRDEGCTDYFTHFSIVMDDIQQEITDQTGELPRAVVADNNEPRPAGRPTVDILAERQEGAAVRHQLTIRLEVDDLRRPLEHDMDIFT
jgi:DDE superfamily endonuclease